MTVRPMISVVVPTCNRIPDIKRCLTSLTKVRYPCWEVLIVDQSDDALTEAAVSTLVDQLPQLSYLRSHYKGASRARNTGMRMARGDIVAFLDDDCTVVGADWLERVAEAFERHPEASLIFGSARAAPHDAHTWWVYCYDVPNERVLTGKLDFFNVGGGAGSMYIRMAACGNVGPMDVHAGPGTRFPSAEDREYAYRHLAAGNTIVETPAIVVEHHGARDYESGAVSRLVRLAAFSQGAVEIKLLRCGDPVGGVLFLRSVLRNLARIDLMGLVSRERPTHIGWFLMYLYGCIVGLRVPVIRAYRLWGRLEDYDLADFRGRPEASVEKPAGPRSLAS